MKNKLQTWWYEFRYGHPFLLDEEVDIILETREAKSTKWMNDDEIQKLVKIKVREMYKKKFPHAKQFKYF